MGMTLVEKIISSHAGKDVHAGEWLRCRMEPDL